MRREQFEHAVRAAGAVLGVHEILVIESQAVHATLAGPLPEEAARSMEVDVAVRGDEGGRMADLLDGSIGEASMFHATFGYYAQGVSPSTAVLPRGWQDRLVRFETPGTHGVVAWTPCHPAGTDPVGRSPLASEGSMRIGTPSHLPWIASYIARPRRADGRLRHPPPPRPAPQAPAPVACARSTPR